MSRTVLRTGNQEILSNTPAHPLNILDSSVVMMNIIIPEVLLIHGTERNVIQLTVGESWLQFDHNNQLYQSPSWTFTIEVAEMQSFEGIGDNIIDRLGDGPPIMLRFIDTKRVVEIW